MSLPKTLNFYCDTRKLHKEQAKIVLVFEKPENMKLLEDQGVVAWRVLAFKKNPNSTAIKKFEVQWEPHIAVSQVHLAQPGNIVTSDSIPAKVEPGQNVELYLDRSESEDPQWRYLPNTPGSKLITVTNSAGSYQNICVGSCVGGGGYINTMFYYGSVGHEQTIDIPKLHYYLKAYAGYQEVEESELMTADKVTREPILTVNLSSLGPSTDFQLVPQSDGSYRIYQGKPEDDE